MNGQRKIVIGEKTFSAGSIGINKNIVRYNIPKNKDCLTDCLNKTKQLYIQFFTLISIIFHSLTIK